jgi:ADP-heptose:LPS heptosyltransferase
VLTTPVLRCLKQQLENTEIHFFTKKQFSSILEGNSDVDKIITMTDSINEVVESLKAEKYDHVVDLHNNIRTLSLKKKLNLPATTFPKLNWKKWLLVKFKKNRMPDVHVVDRYFEAVRSIGIKKDNGLGVFNISDDQKVDVQMEFGISPKEFICIAIGAKFRTKQMPKELLLAIIKGVNKPIVLIGDVTDESLAVELTSSSAQKIYNACGKYNLKGSASIVGQCSKLLTNDTGMMHIAACLNIPVVSVWGNTVPELGMYPYYPGRKEMYSIHEVKDLSCRPCSKIGYQKCPKGHFKCMNKQNTHEIVVDLGL